MSRALNVDATIDNVLALAAKHNATVSAIEPLSPDGTRVVFQNSEDAAVIARALGRRVRTGPVRRGLWQQRRIG